MLEENTILQKLACKFPKPAYQVNQFLESDAELIRVPGGGYLAISTDSIVEEITSGLYREPFLIGWMTVVANLSDLAASGAVPTGLVLNQSFPDGLPWAYLDEIQRGILQACQDHDTYILGGDTNECPVVQMGATAIGVIDKPPILTRKGAAPGDQVYVTGQMGSGNAFAFETLLSKKRTHPYYPEARIREGKFIRHWASACIDTSDGLIPAICNLVEINQTGFKIESPIEYLLHPVALELSASNQLPPWIFLSGPHGEYELLFTVPETDTADFEEHAQKIGFTFQHIGRCTNTLDLSFASNTREYLVNPFEIANAFHGCGKDPRAYLSSLLLKDASWKNHSKTETSQKMNHMQ